MKTRNLLFCLLSCLIGTGAAFAQEETTVFSETFDTSESFSKFTVIDVAQDSETWLYYQELREGKCVVQYKRRLLDNPGFQCDRR